jgi:hypothetical protein
LEACRNGLHLCRTRDLPYWVLEGAVIWRVEVNDRFTRVDETDKVVVREARLTEPVGVLTARVLRLFAADCAESVAHLHGRDPRCMEAIRVARLFAHGLTTHAHMKAAGFAAGAAAGFAAGAAAWDAAWAARDAAGSSARYAAGDAARYAAGSSARYAAGDAARYAAMDAAGDAQGENLLALTARYGSVD